MIREPQAKDLMSRPVRKLVLTAGVQDAARFMLRWSISGAPVVDTHGNAVGVFSFTDMARHVQERVLSVPELDSRKERVKETGEFVPTGLGYHFEAFEQTKVSELMTPGVVTLPADALLSEIVKTMTTFGIHRIFISDKGGAIEGVITTMDILKWVEKTSFRPAKRVQRSSK